MLQLKEYCIYGIVSMSTHANGEQGERQIKYVLPLSFSFCSHNSSKMKPSQSALAHVSILLLTATTYPAVCNAKTIVVEPTESIQEALDHASDGDNIHVKPGLYYEGSR